MTTWQLAEHPAVHRRPGERPAVVLLWTGLGGMLLGNIAPYRALLVVVPVLVLVTACRAGADRWSAVRVPLSLLVVVGWMLTSWTWSAEPAGSVRSFVDLLMAVGVGVVVGAVLDPDRIRRTLAGLFKVVLAANVAALLIAPEWATRPPEDDPVPGWHGVMGHKNGLGAFIVLAVAVLLLQAGRRRYAWLLVAAVLLVGSQSASGLGVCLVLVAVALWAGTLRGMQQASLRAAVRILSLVSLALGASFLASAPGLVARSLGRSETLTGRTEVWGAVVKRIVAEPWLGLGWGGVWRESSPVTQQIWREARFPAFYAHNGYLDVVLQIGVVGGALFLWLLVATFVGLLAQDPGPGRLWGVLVLLGLCLTAITESSPFTGSVGLLLIAMLSTAVQQRRDPPDLPALLTLRTPAVRSRPSASRLAPT